MLCIQPGPSTYFNKVPPRLHRDVSHVLMNGDHVITGNMQILPGAPPFPWPWPIQGPLSTKPLEGASLTPASGHHSQNFNFQAKANKYRVQSCQSIRVRIALYSRPSVQQPVSCSPGDIRMLLAESFLKTNPTALAQALFYRAQTPS